MNHAAIADNAYALEAEIKRCVDALSQWRRVATNNHEKRIRELEGALRNIERLLSVGHFDKDIYDVVASTGVL